VDLLLCTSGASAVGVESDWLFCWCDALRDCLCDSLCGVRTLDENSSLKASDASDWSLFLFDGLLDLLVGTSKAFAVGGESNVLPCFCDDLLALLVGTSKTFAVDGESDVLSCCCDGLLDLLAGTLIAFAMGVESGLLSCCCDGLSAVPPSGTVGSSESQVSVPMRAICLCRSLSICSAVSDLIVLDDDLARPILRPPKAAAKAVTPPPWLLIMDGHPPLFSADSNLPFASCAPSEDGLPLPAEESR